MMYCRGRGFRESASAAVGVRGDFPVKSGAVLAKMKRFFMYFVKKWVKTEKEKVKTGNEKSKIDIILKRKVDDILNDSYISLNGRIS